MENHSGRLRRDRARASGREDVHQPTARPRRDRAGYLLKYIVIGDTGVGKSCLLSAGGASIEKALRRDGLQDDVTSMPTPQK